MQETPQHDQEMTQAELKAVLSHHERKQQRETNKVINRITADTKGDNKP